jgi:hypothetical protein
MNDKDKEAFEAWWRNTFHTDPPLKSSIFTKDIQDSWQAACEYMRIKHGPLDSLSLYEKLEREREENKKLREALEFYAEPWERGEWEGDLLVRKIGSYDQFIEVHLIAREALKEVGEK